MTMPRPFTILLLGLALGFSPRVWSQAPQVELVVQVATPPGTPADASLHLAGNANRWNPADPAWALVRQTDGTWQGRFRLEAGYALQFKITRGSWETVEKDAQGGELPNRLALVQAGASLRVQVAAWRDQAPAVAPASTATGDLRIHRDLPAPELGGTRTVRILLPPGYETGQARYPVLYMQDGQNLFDAATAFAGEWQVDESLARLTAEGQVPPLIVVGVDHGGDTRLRDYAPFADPRIPQPRGDAYADFLARTLKPWVDRTYRTRPGLGDTAVAGSSMGGLIALHAALRHPAVFGRAACFSSSFWVGGRAILKALERQRPGPGLRLYLDAGLLEGGTVAERGQMAQDTRAVADRLLARGLPEARLKVVLDPEGVHSESAWARRFPAALVWLMADRP